MARNEVELATALIEGRPNAFDEFVETFRIRIFQYSYLMCGQRDDAEEVAQDTLLKVFEHLHTLRDPTRVRAWIFRIAKNSCLMKRRRSSFAPYREISLETYLEGVDGENRHQIADRGILPDEEAERREMSGALERAIRSLSPSYRSVILLRDVEELSTEDTAHVLDVSADVVKQRLHRARLALRKALATHAFAEAGSHG